MADSVVSNGDIILDDEAAHAAAEKEWQEKGTGPLASNNIDFGIKYRPREKDVENMSKGFRKVWKEYYTKRPDRPILNFATGPL
jgi:alcohol oxidase